MSDVAPPPDQRSSPAPADEHPPQIPMWLILAAVGVLVVVAAGGGIALLRAQQQSHSGPSYPDHWDSRIAPYAKIAEKKRGLFFVHPVKVRFLPPRKFEKTVTSDKSELDKDDRKEIKQFTGLMRAFGLLKGDVDLFDASNEASGAGTLAYYSYDDKSITIRGKVLTPAVRVTLVHELTHVLQDQHFDIGARQKKLNKEADDGASNNESSVLDALIEGDAERVATLYRKSLGPKQRKAADAGTDDEVKHASKRLKRVPKVVTTMMMSPYALGQGMVEAVAAKGGNSAVDQLFRDTPKHETALFDPFLVLTGRAGATKVDTPSLREGEKKFDSGELGVLTWYFMLAERMPLRDALAAADGWHGDAYVAYEQGGTSCVRMNYTGLTQGDTARMLAALHRWVAAAPGSPARVTRAGDVVRFQSCDPGKAADVGNDASEDAMGLVTVRTGLGTALLRRDTPVDVAACYSTRVSEGFTLSQLTSQSYVATHPAAQAKLQRIGASCR